MKDLLNFIEDSPVLELVAFNHVAPYHQVPPALKLVLEGVDGCGKTYEADKTFRLMHGWINVISVHAIPSNNGPVNWYSDWDRVIRRLFVRNNSVSIVMDRGWACEYVYAEFFERKPPHIALVRALDNLAFDHCIVERMSKKSELQTYYDRLDDKDKQLFKLKDLEKFQRRYEKIWKFR